MSVHRATESTADHGKHLPRELPAKAQPWIRRLARFGYAAKGLVYTIIGILALQAAIGPGGKTTDTRGAVRTILHQPFGSFMVAILAVGLVGYTIWRLVEAIWDVEDKGRKVGGIIKRIGYGLSGLVYGGLALTAVQMLIGARGGHDSSTQRWTARFLAVPYGQWLIATAGLILIGLCFNALYLAYTARFCEKLQLSHLSRALSAGVVGVGKVGLAARGVVFGVIGGFMIQAALMADPNKARGLAGVLKVLAQQANGLWLLGVVAAGFIAYGLYQFSAARYRRILAD